MEFSRFRYLLCSLLNLHGTECFPFRYGNVLEPLGVRTWVATVATCSVLGACIYFASRLYHVAAAPLPRGYRLRDACDIFLRTLPGLVKPDGIDRWFQLPSFLAGHVHASHTSRRNTTSKPVWLLLLSNEAFHTVQCVHACVDNLLFCMGLRT